MNDRPPYRKWVGVVLGFLIHGSAHFLSGKRATGLRWFLCLYACIFAGIAFVATPGTIPFILGVGLLLAGIALCLAMLKQSYRPIRRISLLGWFMFIVLAVVLNEGGSFLYHQSFRPFRVPGLSMSPTIIPGDRLLVERLSYRFGKPQRGDIVVFHTKGLESFHDDTLYMKRIVGLPGECIQIDPPFLIANDHKVLEPGILNTISSATNGYAGFQLSGQLSKPTDEIILGPDEYFVISDNTANSRDSRYWGGVPGINIIGKVARIYWPLTRINALEGK